MLEGANRTAFFSPWPCEHGEHSRKSMREQRAYDRDDCAGPWHGDKTASLFVRRCDDLRRLIGSPIGSPMLAGLGLKHGDSLACSSTRAIGSVRFRRREGGFGSGAAQRRLSRDELFIFRARGISLVTGIAGRARAELKRRCRNCGFRLGDDFTRPNLLNSPPTRRTASPHAFEPTMCCCVSHFGTTAR